MSAAGGGAPSRLGTAVALLTVVVFMSVFDALPLVVLPMSVLLLALPSRSRLRLVAFGLAALAAVLVLPAGGLGAISVGWALALGGAFAAVTLLRREWPFFPRALTAVAVVAGAAVIWLAASGQWSEMDWMMRQHFSTVSSLALADLGARMPEENSWLAEFSTATQRVAELQWTLFPAFLALQSLAALGLASLWVGRMRRGEGDLLGLRRLREFRFNDQLIWLVIGALALLVLPLGALATRVAYNVLVFMGTLYALRGVAVFMFLAGGAPSVLMVLLGTVVVLFLYPLVLTAALLVGVGDTWLDVRRREALAPRA